MANTPGTNNSSNWEIFFKRTLNGGKTWKNLRRLTYDAGYSDNPKLAWNGNKLLTIWADRDTSGAPWEMQTRSSSNKGRTWGTTTTISTGASAWKPAVVWDATNQKFFLVYNDYQTGFPDLMFSTSADGRNWIPPDVIMENPTNAYRRDPQVGYTAGSVYVVWEELNPVTGDWVIETATRP
jgi:hypothetical protein